jgi:hypothetical protein
MRRNQFESGRGLPDSQHQGSHEPRAGRTAAIAKRFRLTRTLQPPASSSCTPSHMEAPVGVSCDALT